MCAQGLYPKSITFNIEDLLPLLPPRPVEAKHGSQVQPGNIIEFQGDKYDVLEVNRTWMAVRLQGAARAIRLRRIAPFRIIGQGKRDDHAPQVGVMVTVGGKGPFMVVDVTASYVVAVAGNGGVVKFKPFADWMAVQSEPTELQTKAGAAFESVQPGDIVKHRGDECTVVEKKRDRIHLRDPFAKIRSVPKWAPIDRVDKK